MNSSTIILGSDVPPASASARGPFDHATLFATAGLHASILPGTHRTRSLLSTPFHWNGRTFARVSHSATWNDGCTISLDEMIRAAHRITEGRSRISPTTGTQSIVELLEFDSLSWEALSGPASLISEDDVHRHLSTGTHRLIYASDAEWRFEALDRTNPAILIRFIKLADAPAALESHYIDISPPLGTIPFTRSSVSSTAETNYVAGLEVASTHIHETIPVPSAYDSSIASDTYTAYKGNSGHGRIPSNVDEITWVDYAPNEELLFAILQFYNELLGYTPRTREITYNEYITHAPRGNQARLGIWRDSGRYTIGYFPLFRAKLASHVRKGDEYLLNQINSDCMFDWTLNEWGIK